MPTVCFRLQLAGKLATPLKGDTLFGQSCWALRHLYGVEQLEAWLAAYPRRPFLVWSDAFPAGYLPKPTLPPALYLQAEAAGQADSRHTDRKTIKKRRWIPREAWGHSLRDTLTCAHDDQDVLNACGKPVAGPNTLTCTEVQPHNSINRQTGTTGSEGFAPYGVDVIWHHPAVVWEVYAVYDDTAISQEQVAAALDYIGSSGYGRDASVGLGKFQADLNPAACLPHHPHGDAVCTLAPCAPQHGGFSRERSFYLPFTRFGRHGDSAALSSNPFKKPALLADTAAILAGGDPQQPWAGQALTGVSNTPAFSAAVQQGYAPILRVSLESLLWPKPF